MAQTTALDFTLEDCDGVSHHLFDELDQGKVVILEFAMIPSCQPCISAGGVLQQIRDDHEVNEPGRVKWYPWGFSQAYTCAQMGSWTASHSLSPSATFTDGSDMVDYYGGMGMPTIVVLAGSGHQVIYNHQGYSASMHDQIEAAISSVVGMQEATPMAMSFAVYPDPAIDVLTLNAVLPEAARMAMVVYDAAGRAVTTVPEVKLAAGTHKLPISVSGLANGHYVLALSGTSGTHTFPFQINR